MLRTHPLSFRGVVASPVNITRELTVIVLGFDIQLRERERENSFDYPCLFLPLMSTVHHLLTVHELLGTILLVLHNTHQFVLFFHSIRSAIKSGAFEELRQGYRSRLASGLVPS